jgi:hypothetical protein
MICSGAEGNGEAIDGEVRVERVKGGVGRNLSRCIG